MVVFFFLVIIAARPTAPIVTTISTTKSAERTPMISSTGTDPEIPLTPSRATVTIAIVVAAARTDNNDVVLITGRYMARFVICTLNYDPSVHAARSKALNKSISRCTANSAQSAST